MNIRFVSSLTPDDEDRIAPGLMQAVSQLLDAVPIAYTLRVETATGKLYQHAHTAGTVEPDDVDSGQRLPETARESQEPFRVVVPAKLDVP